MKIQYNKGDLVGPYSAVFLYETESDVQPCGKKNRRAQFLCPYCKTKEFNARISEVRRGKIRSCGCYKTISKLKTHSVDISNQRHGSLVALYRTQEKAKDNSYLWVCQCDCGNTTKLTTSAFKKIYSCGCKRGFTQGEKILADFLDQYSIIYNREFVFDDCIGIKNFPLRFDFYLPSFNCCVELDGPQHRAPVERFGGEDGFKILCEHDKIKNQYCQNHQIKLIRIPYERRDFPLTEERLKQIFTKEGILNG